MNKKAKILTFVLLAVIALSILATGIFMTGCGKKEKLCRIGTKEYEEGDHLCIPKSDWQVDGDKWDSCSDLLSPSQCASDDQCKWVSATVAGSEAKSACEKYPALKKLLGGTCNLEEFCASPTPSPSPRQSPRPT